MVAFWISFSAFGAATAASLLLLDRVGEMAAAAILGGGVLVFLAGLVLTDRAKRGDLGPWSVLMSVPEEMLADRTGMARMVAFMASAYGPGWTLEVVTPLSDPDEVEISSAELARLIQAGKISRDVRYVVVAPG
jgi:hypothetical protein